ncbi:hypothetical protein BC749_1011383 [Flavobacterium araucananum]|nr:hypothetical protein BC749_1011383 [Flavobacterium araucananum]
MLFHLSLKFEMPDKNQLDLYYDKLLSSFSIYLQNILRKYNIFHPETKDDIDTTMKRQIIEELVFQKEL